MGFIVGTGATSPESARGGSGVVTNVTGNSITVAKDSNDFVAGEKLVVEKESNSITTWTWSGWVKLADLDKVNQFFGADLASSQDPTENFQFYYSESTRKIYVHTFSHNVFISQVTYADSSVWSHIVLAIDTTKIAAAERVKLYLNNELLEAETYNAPDKNYGFAVNKLLVHGVGCHPNESGTYEVDGYMTDINFIDGLQLDPSYFASALSGKWEPKRYHGRYGVFGWHIIGGDDAPDGDTGIGADSSGNNSDWADEGFNLTTGAQQNIAATSGFGVIRYTGTGSSRIVRGLDFQPDLVWIKEMDGTSFNWVHDSLRGTTRSLYTNDTQNEAYTPYGLTGWWSDGFSLGTGHGQINTAGKEYVAWCWNADVSAQSSEGTVTSELRVSEEYGFSIVRWTGVRVPNTQVGHGLGKEPKWITVKNMDVDGTNWITWVGQDNANQYIRLNDSDPLQTAGSIWSSTAPNDTVFTVGQDSETNGDGARMVAYCWSEIENYSSFGNFTHTGQAQSVTTGFKPAYVIVKSTSVTSNWFIFDNKRDTNNALSANTSGPEAPGFAVTFNDDGFSWLGGSFTAGEYWYAAFASDPGVSDIMSDSPDLFGIDEGNGGEFASNYSTMSPLDTTANIGTQNGSLVVGNVSDGWYGIRGTIGATSGKWYYEVSSTISSIFVGIATSDVDMTTANPQDNTSIMSKGALVYCDDGKYLLDQGGSAARQDYDNGISVGDVLGVAYDLDNATVQFYKNGVGLGVIDISGSALLQGIVLPYHISYYSGQETTFNFGATPFKYPAPDGYKCVTTDSLPTPLVTDSTKAFDIVTYRGNGDNQTIDSLNFQPDLVWIKSRTSVTWHNIFDASRGADKAIYTNASNSQTGNHSPQRLSAFTEDGFTLGANTDCNNLGDDYVAWCWKAGDSEIANVNGSIISTVRSNPSYGFSIVRYSGTGANATVGHGLGATPEMILVKKLVGADMDWAIYHSGAQETGARSAKFNFDKFANDNTTWQDQPPNSTNFSVGVNPESNSPVQDMVAYCWSEVPGFSKFGSFNGNGSNDHGPFIYCGFKPAFVLLKCYTNDGQGWSISDSAREGYNSKNTLLFPNNHAAENASTYMDLVDNGFHLRSSSGFSNATGFAYVYAAFAEKPLGF